MTQYGFNEIAREEHPSALIRLLRNVKNPLVILLTALGVLSFLTGDQRATVVIFVMVLLGVVLRFVQETRADRAAEQLEAMVSNTATVVRDGQESELSLKMLVPGDIVRRAVALRRSSVWSRARNADAHQSFSCLPGHAMVRRNALSSRAATS